MRCAFAADAVAAASTWATLRLEGVDTVADVLLNGERVGRVAGAFQPFDLAVSGAVREGSNELALRLLPARHVAAERAARYPYEVPHTENYNVWLEPSHRNFMRKVRPSIRAAVAALSLLRCLCVLQAGSDFGWDWGARPRFAFAPRQPPRGFILILHAQARHLCPQACTVRLCS